MADDETVWLPPSKFGTREGGKKRRFHPDRDCQHLVNSDPRPIDRTIAADEMELEECLTCQGITPRPDNRDFSAYKALKKAADRRAESEGGAD